ncbi:sulfotransferase domain-containing protein [Phenylobacterium sp.]|uniref:sulfotransferase domain-containing protein n=1 Tax=Phenylobacterium sp. TaxID=1871053 RepID=UPI0025EFDA5C|nr:sulfotransferase domain-containing protein [Phenylobacterium sp.]MBX3485985.1 sulfotransferase domain-containing protein [Phenylobacterium sp.]MCW5760582.1 sulfotransferase domain-containing protein [Phenylobacterium sp.]
MPTLERAPTRPYRTVLMNSRRWDGFRPRPGDIVVATYPKCGTTWTQRIVDMLIHQSTAPRTIMELYPWLDATFFAPVAEDLATLEGQTHRRAIKSHLPFDSLPVYDAVKYVHVARDGRDACFSFHNHMRSFTDTAHEKVGGAAVELMAELGMPADAPAPAPPETPEDPRDFYLNWMDEAEAGPQPLTDLSFFEFEMTYWRERARPNLLLVHYNDLKADLAGEIARISDFLEIDTPAATVAEIAAAAGFDAMKAQGPDLLPTVEVMFQGGSQTFLNKGTNGRWKAALTGEDLARFDRLSTAKFTPAARAWIEGGRLAAGDPRGADN